ncbi:MAG: TetR/AcrR family transcriptional regulator [Rhodobiaceae bacterium]|nr:TetR/AcrR family transcriptional regulator [Rhodobiaceae bacterium]
MQIADAADAPTGTRRKLLVAAEKMFALHGVEGASLRQITHEAGQRNESALQYHFGSREALIDEILKWRMGAIDRRRSAMVDDILADGREGDLRTLVSAVVIPLSEPARNSDEPNYYNRFLVEMHRSKGPTIDQRVAGKYDHGIQRVSALMARLLDHVPERIMRQRFAMVAVLITAGVANIEDVMSRRRLERREFNFDRAIDNLTDMAAAAVAAPISSETRKGLVGQERSRARGGKLGN